MAMFPLIFPYQPTLMQVKWHHKWTRSKDGSIMETKYSACDNSSIHSRTGVLVSVKNVEISELTADFTMHAHGNSDEDNMFLDPEIEAI